MQPPDPSDQLVDLMLMEILGGEQAPDLSGRILRQASQRVGRRRRRWWIGGIAAAAVLAVIGIWIMGAGYPQPMATGAVTAADGGVIGRGSVLSNTTQATVALGGYIRVTMEAASRIKIEGRPRDEIIYLQAGQIVSEVDRGHGAFSVRTDDGVVRVMGTRFLVAVRPIDRGDSMETRTFVKVLMGTVVVSGVWGSQTLQAGTELTMPSAAINLTEVAAEAGAAAVKTGEIKSVEAKAKTFVLDLAARPLTFTVNEKTIITLGDKASTFEAAIKVHAKVSVTYTRDGENRIATKIVVTAAKK